MSDHPNARAKSRLLEDHRAAVRKFFRRKITNLSIVDDLTQETMLAGLRGFHSIECPERFRRWLIGIARNKLRDQYRRNRRARTVPDRHAAVWAFEREDPDTPFEAIVAEQDKHMVAEMLDRLPQPTQRLLRQFYWEEVGRVEIAKSLGIPASTVGSRLCYVRKQLRAQLVAVDSFYCLR